MATRALGKTTSKLARLNILRAGNLGRISWLIHGFSTRLGGSSRAFGGMSLNLGYIKGDAKAAVDRNRMAFLRGLGTVERSRRGKLANTWPLITTRQIHSDLIHFVDAETKETPTGDGLITATPGIALGIQTADCLPIILVDSKRRAIGVFHAGWRGTLKRIVEKGVGEMHRHFGTNAADIRAAIGPGIGNCCYEVGEEVRAKFESQFSYAETLFHEVKDSDPVREKYPLLFLTARAPGHSELPKKIFLDLVEANLQQLLAVGVRKGSIQASPFCTNCRTDFLFSYRGEKGKTGRMMAVAGIRE